MRILTLLFATILSLGLVATTVGHGDDAEGAVLYEVDQESGEATAIDTIGDGLSVIGLALAPPPVDETEPALAYALTTDGVLVLFALDNPSEIIADVAVYGLGDDEALIGIDVRPATGELFAVSSASIIYVLDPETGEASTIDGPFDPALEDVFLGFDFNPTVDRIRADVSTTQNLRLNPDTGMVGTNPDTGEPTIDGNLAYAAGDDNKGETPFAVGAGYTNSFADAEATELYVIDAALDVLTIQDPPNDGVLNTVGALGVDATELTGFDIAPPTTDDPADEGIAYAAITPVDRDDDDDGDDDDGGNNGNHDDDDDDDNNGGNNGGGDDNDDNQGGNNGGDYNVADVQPASYINPDTGMPTENPDVDSGSECATPDQQDTQPLSDPEDDNNNVHNDACLFNGDGRGDDDRVDGPASFVSSGVGFISACPDPDGDGEQTATLADDDGDGAMDRCTQTGFQNTGKAGDTEFHARLNNADTPGQQVVDFCFDPELNGCYDAAITDTIVIEWVADDETGGDTGEAATPAAGAVVDADVDADVEVGGDATPAVDANADVEVDVETGVVDANVGVDLNGDEDEDEEDSTEESTDEN